MPEVEVFSLYPGHDVASKGLRRVAEAWEARLHQHFSAGVAGCQGCSRGPKDTYIRILQTRVYGILVVLGLKVRMKDPCVL